MACTQCDGCYKWHPYFYSKTIWFLLSKIFISRDGEGGKHVECGCINCVPQPQRFMDVYVGLHRSVNDLCWRNVGWINV